MREFRDTNVTVRDIARVAGVSPSTVSRALTQPEMVAPRRREQIQRLAAEMGYQPNPAARGLTTGETRNIGVVVPDLENPLFASLVKGTQSRARSGGYAVFVSDSEEDAHLESELLDSLAPRVDGFVLFSPRMRSELLRQYADRLPMVLVNRPVEGIHSLAVDNRDGMRQAVMHLRALGHSVVAHVSGPADSWADETRGEGLRAAAENEGVTIIELGHVAPVFSGGVSVADRVLSSGATAVICYNDLIALGVLSRLTTRGIDVPSQISVIGFDDVPAATLVSPALTTLSAPLKRMGQEAVDRLLVEIAERSSAGHRSFTANLVVRDSTTVPPQNDVLSGPLPTAASVS